MLSSGCRIFKSIIQRIASAASAINLIHTTADHLTRAAYFDAPDDLALSRPQGEMVGSEIGSFLNIPLTVENRIIGMLSLFDEKLGTFDTDLFQMTAMIADYAAIALENFVCMNARTLSGVKQSWNVCACH